MKTEICRRKLSFQNKINNPVKQEWVCAVVKRLKRKEKRNYI